VTRAAVRRLTAWRQQLRYRARHDVHYGDT